MLPWTRRLQQQTAARIAGRLVLRPTRDVIDAGDQERYLIRRDALQIECFVHRTGANRHAQAVAEPVIAALHDAPPPQLLVIKLPGTAGRAERSSPQPADFLPQWRGEVWTWNPPGYGRSRGTLSLAGIPAAAEIFYDQVVGMRASAATRVWIVGNSLGCATALYLASVRDAHGLILRNPPPLTEVIPHVASGHRWRRLSMAVAGMIAAGIPDAMNALKTAPRAAAPALFLQSDLDTLIPPAMQAQVRAVYAGPQRLVRLTDLTHHQPADDRHLPAVRDGVAWLAAHPHPK